MVLSRSALGGLSKRTVAKSTIKFNFHRIELHLNKNSPFQTIFFLFLVVTLPDSPLSQKTFATHFSTRVLGHCTGDHKIYSTSKRLPEIQENWPRRNQVYFILLFRIRRVVVISYLHAKKITRWKIWFQRPRARYSPTNKVNRRSVLFFRHESERRSPLTSREKQIRYRRQLPLTVLLKIKLGMFMQSCGVTITRF